LTTEILRLIRRFAGGEALLLTLTLTGCNLVATTATPSPTAGAAAGPVLRSGAAVAYDDDRHHLVVFGGTFTARGVRRDLNDIWIWNGRSWLEKHPLTRPAARSGALMAYDGSNKQLILHGGTSGSAILNDSWSWDGMNWTEYRSGTNPPPRQEGAMAYDPITRKLVLAGGSDSRGLLGDTWTWEGSAWQKRSDSTPLLTPGALAFDGLRLVLFGTGQVSEHGRYFAQTWAWDASSWNRLRPAVNLPAGYGYRPAYDPSHHTVVVIGPMLGSGHPDTWIWDGSTWSRKHPTVSPPERYRGVLFFDAALGKTMLYGGDGMADLWGWDGSNWTLVDPGPPAQQTPYTKPGVTSQVAPPTEAAGIIRKTVTGASPVLLPTWLPAELIEAQADVSQGGFNVTYLSDNRDKKVGLAIVVPNPPPGGPNAESRTILFRGSRSGYRVDDATALLSARWLMWINPGTMAEQQTKDPGVPYFLTADGLSEEEFWRVANSLSG
jgi:hypothetical protein